MQHVLNILQLSSIYFLVALSFALMYEATRLFNLAHGAIITLSAYLVYCFYQQLGLNYFLSITLSLLIVTLIGTLIFLGPLRSLIRAKATSLSYLVSSLGIYIVLTSFISLIWGNATINIQTHWLNAIVSTGRASIATYSLLLIIVAAIIYFLISLFLKKLPMGNRITCVSQNPELSRIFGINVERIQIATFMTASLIGGLAGFFYGYGSDLSPWMGFQVLLYGIIAMIVGGIGSKKGIFISSLAIATLQYGAAYFIESKWMDGVAFVCLLLILIFRPLGFSGRKLKKIEV